MDLRGEVGGFAIEISSFVGPVILQNRRVQFGAQKLEISSANPPPPPLP